MIRVAAEEAVSISVSPSTQRAIRPWSRGGLQTPSQTGCRSERGSWQSGGLSLCQDLSLKTRCSVNCYCCSWLSHANVYYNLSRSVTFDWTENIYTIYIHWFLSWCIWADLPDRQHPDPHPGSHRNSNMHSPDRQLLNEQRSYQAGSDPRLDPTSSWLQLPLTRRDCLLYTIIDQYFPVTGGWWDQACRVSRLWIWKVNGVIVCNLRCLISLILVLYQASYSACERVG